MINFDRLGVVRRWPLLALVVVLGAGCWQGDAPPAEAPTKSPPPFMKVKAPSQEPPPLPVVPKPQEVRGPTEDAEAPDAPDKPAEEPPSEPGLAKVSEDEGLAETAKPEKGITLANMLAIREGMEHSEVMALFNSPGVTISSSGSESAIYRWSAEGASFLGRFEDGRLTRKTLLGGDKDKEKAKDGAQPVLTEAQYNSVHEDMSLQDVMNMLNVEARLVSGGGEHVVIYKWTDEKGSTFTARFEDGKLVRKTGLVVAPLEPSKEAGSDEEPAPEDEEPEESEATEGEEVHKEELEGEEGEGEERGVIDLRDRFPADEIEPGDFEAPAEEEQTYVRERPQVRVAGADRRAREAEGEPSPVQGRSYKPKAKLPKYSHSLRRGSYEVRVFNHGESKVSAGLRSEKRGKDLTISPGGHRSVRVDRGVYEVYFIYKDAPYTLHRGQRVPIDGEFLADVSVHLFNEATDVRILDYGRY